MNAPVAATNLARPAVPTRPVLRYHGGKWRLAPWIISHLPPHRVYVEPFGGAASVLMRKPRAYAEIYNDLDGDVANVFRVLRDRVTAAELRRLVELTPYARDEFLAAYEPSDEPIERARRLMILSFMGRGSSGVLRHSTGFRGRPFRDGSTAASGWLGFPDAIPAMVERLRGVIIDNRPAEHVIAENDHADTLYYLDPPYMFGTRSPKRKRGDLYHVYRHELDDAGHAQLLAQLLTLVGMVVLSGYTSALYDAALASWLRVERRAWADEGQPRTEVLWINPAAAERLAQRGLFDGGVS